MSFKRMEPEKLVWLTGAPYWLLMDAEGKAISYKTLMPRMILYEHALIQD